jgi:hypothetical protein
MFQISKVSCLIGIIATSTNGAPSLKIIYIINYSVFYETKPVPFSGGSSKDAASRAQ